MFLTTLTLQAIVRQREPAEGVGVLEQRAFFESRNAMKNIQFSGFDLGLDRRELLQGKIFFTIDQAEEKHWVQFNERGPRRILEFYCPTCEETTVESPCLPHWIAYLYLWQALHEDELSPAALADFSRALREHLGTQKSMRQKQGMITDADVPSDTYLESISLIFEQSPVLGPGTLEDHLPESLSRYTPEAGGDGNDLLAPTAWNMPEVFRKKLVAYSGYYLHEVNEQIRMSSVVAYNFSHGVQVSAKDILRHPLYKKVPAELLPRTRKGSDPASASDSVWERWPLANVRGGIFFSQNLRDLEAIMQNLLAEIALQLRQKKIKVFLQSSLQEQKALSLEQIEFDSSRELTWRVDFSEKKSLEAEIKLISREKSTFFFFENFALDPKAGLILPLDWFREWKELREKVQAVQPPEAISAHLASVQGVHLASDSMPRIDLIGEHAIRRLLAYLRSRLLPVHIVGDSRTLKPERSYIEIHLNEAGHFDLCLGARVSTTEHSEKDLIRRGWTPHLVRYLKALSEGVTYLAGQEARDIAGRSRRKRDWDLKLLKHLGILQYLTLEALSVHFEGHMLDGKVVGKEHLFSALENKIQNLLVSHSGEILAREAPLRELCSLAVVKHLEDFLVSIFKTLPEKEFFYSEQGEVILQGAVEKEFRLLFEILRMMALYSNGEVFKKSRTSLLARIWSGDLEQDPDLQKGSFFLPSFASLSTGTKGISQLHEALEIFQPLIPAGFKIFFKDQPLQELDEDDFRVDFNVATNSTGNVFNWFELNPRFFLLGQEINPEQVGSFGQGGVVEYQGKMYLVPRQQMPSLKRLENFWLKLQKGKQESKTKKWAEKVYQMPRNQTLELLALRASGYAIRGDEEWKKLCDFYDQLGTQSRELNLPPSTHADLKPYQRVGIQWLQDLYQLKMGALLADDMGLGKTLQTLAFLDDLRAKKEMQQVLVIVPSSLIFNWQSEIEKFTPELPLAVFSGREKENIGRALESKKDLVVICTYGLLMEHESFFSQYHWKILIFDEAQNLKNITTKRTSSARTLQAQFKICLTGTPMENHYGEFYSLVDLLVPGSLGKIEDFRRQFVNSENISRESIEDLKLKIKPLMLRRTKKEILDQLPEKQETKVSIAFEDVQREIYRDIALAYNQKVQESIATEGEARVQLQMLTAILRLRQACSDPAALPNVTYDKVPPKLEALQDSLGEIVESGESALVFTQFLQTLEHTEKLMKQAGIPAYVLHGGIPTKQRQKILADFNAEKGGAVLIMTLKTGGVGLNLTKASYVFHIEPWWNPSVENQATDRAHRLGQSKAVQVFRYIMHESLEEKIEVLKSRKDQKFVSLFGTNANSMENEKDLGGDVGPGTGALSKADFDILLGV